MNIFVLHDDPVIAAQMLCNKHVIKMCTEAGQMLSNAFRRHTACPFHGIYEVTHPGHRCTRWAGDTRSNFEWLLTHAEAIVKEYDLRYGKPNKYVKLRHVLTCCRRFINVIPEGPLTEFPQAMPEKYRIPGNAVAAYRQYYIYDKAYFARWKTRKPPTWWPGE